MDEMTFGRLIRKFSVDDGCWLWHANKNAAGYGRFQLDGRGQPAHRVIYELLVGPIPAGLVLDHLCRVHACVNPAHLEPVSQRENLLRGESMAAVNASRVACAICGTPYTDERDKTGSRFCRPCKNRRSLATWHRRMADPETRDRYNQRRREQRSYPGTGARSTDT